MKTRELYVRMTSAFFFTLFFLLGAYLYFIDKDPQRYWFVGASWLVSVVLAFFVVLGE